MRAFLHFELSDSVTCKQTSYVRVLNTFRSCYAPTQRESDVGKVAGLFKATSLMGAVFVSHLALCREFDWIMSN